ncbi:phosphoribosylglycinamide formyltransferase [Pseudoflavonifractor sp. 60]|uniref:phosphoribosylglycinamide formyltransferase n=1 Tax=Pseudoflavonifractor sp. 60 TaxID=2304576 RepID=UPI00136AD095|nr:phosphoribosylglycinamide formyltransferase [Pseudoflavonifractor sp. 60]NBI65440.1 phosphoribosylglycinamide formyltransferase [Pseudoflavonifractor sp. 60]
MKNIAVLVSGGGTNLQALIDAQARGEFLCGEIGMVVSSNPDAYALERAKQANIPGYILPRKNWDSSQAYTHALVSLLQEMGADVVVLAGFMVILTDEIVQAYSNKILNVHPALIPSFCGKGAYGLHVHEQALAYGVKVTGATVHLVTAEPDGGPIVLQKAIDVLPWDTPESLQRRVMEECEWELLPKAVDLLCRDNLKVEGRTVQIIGGRVIV